MRLSWTESFAVYFAAFVSGILVSFAFHIDWWKAGLAAIGFLVFYLQFKTIK